MTGRLARGLLHALAGALVGLLVLGEFALATSLPVLAAFAALAVLSLVAALRGERTISAWALFVFAAMVVPLMIDVRVVGLPRCGTVPASVACFAGERDYHTPFWIELGTFSVAAVASALHLRLASQPGANASHEP